MSDIANTTQLRASLHALAELVESSHFPTVPDGDQVHDLLCTIRTYLLPRLEDLTAPLTLVLVGGTGSGKSTLVNSLAGSPVAKPGVLRPMTRIPVIWCHSSQEDRYADGLVGATVSVPVEVVASDDPFLKNLTVIDSPDIDSVEVAHREIAEALLSVADVCLFVTTPQRYADAVPWEFLIRAQQRDVPLLYAMNRVRGNADEVIDDFSKRMDNGGLDLVFSEVIPIMEQQTLGHGGLPASAITHIKSILQELSEEDDELVIAQATAGSIASLRLGIEVLVDQAVSESARIGQLEALLESRYAQHQAAVGESLVSGTLLRSEITARWEDVLGTGQFMRSVAEGVGKVRGWARRVFGGRVERLEGEARSEISIAIERRTALAASETASAWEMDALGIVLIKGHSDLWSASATTRSEIEIQIDDWAQRIRVLVEERGSGRKTVARAASLGVNVVAVSLMLIVFSQTSGLTGSEVGIAAGAAAVQQTLLESIFGEAALRSLVSEARAELMAAIERVFVADQERFRTLLQGARPEMPAGLVDALEAVEVAAKEFYASPA